MRMRGDASRSAFEGLLHLLAAVVAHAAMEVLSSGPPGRCGDGRTSCCPGTAWCPLYSVKISTRRSFQRPPGQRLLRIQSTSIEMRGSASPRTAFAIALISSGADAHGPRRRRRASVAACIWRLPRPDLLFRQRGAVVVGAEGLAQEAEVAWRWCGRCLGALLTVFRWTSRVRQKASIEERRRSEARS